LRTHSNFVICSREEITVDEKVEKALVAVGDESALREEVSEEESSEDSEIDDEDEAGKQKRQLCTLTK
jgi:hypothetical protein